MPSSNPPDREREQRRRKITRRRRSREAAETIATNTGDIRNLQEKRPPQTAIRQVQNLSTEAVHVSDSLSETVRTASPASYGSSNYGQSAYGSANVD